MELVSVKNSVSTPVRVFLALLLIIFAACAQADVKLLDSFPKSGSKVSGMVTDVRLWFDVEPDPGESKIELVKDDTRIAVLGLHSMGENDLMGFVQQPTPPGRYRFVWRTTAAASDAVVVGEFNFTVISTGSKP